MRSKCLAIFPWHLLINPTVSRAQTTATAMGWLLCRWTENLGPMFLTGDASCGDMVESTGFLSKMLGCIPMIGFKK